ncbi:hypothetical protein SO802_004936 [Lithocarpus litseifolius]|uniref:NB-ARC domain-containing protein n=1 Tax=Lithocarpus litseifolius TaxID=425828 RepID=A0AAW2DGR4_9ROSI
MLNSLLEDKTHVIESGSQVDAKARQLWPTEELNQISIPARLQEPESDWLEKIKEVAGEARNLIDQVKKRRKESDLTFNSVQDKWTFGNDFKQVRDKIEKHLEEKEKFIDIFKKLGKLRSKIRSLQGIAIDDEKKHFSFGQEVGSGAALIDSLMHKVDKLIADADDPHLAHDMEGDIPSLHLVLIRAFLNDLKRFGFETEMEKAWLKEAEEIIVEAQQAIDTFKQETRNQKWWIPSSTNRARCELRKEMKRINTGFSGFLETKERYGFNFIRSFIRRYQSTSVFTRVSHQQASNFQTSDGIDINRIMSDVKKLKEEVRQQTKESEKLKLVFEKFEKVIKQFEEAKTKEGLNSSTTERLKQMRSLADKAECSVNSYIKNSANERGFHIFQTKAQKNLYKEIEHIKGALDILETSIKAYSIELTEEMSSVVGLEEDIREVVLDLISGSEHVVSIVGMKGIGKTTLAKEIYERGDIVEHFSFRAWVSVREMANHDALSIDIAKQVLGTHGSQEEINGRDSWMNKVCDFLKERTYLVVLDNFTEENAWETLKKAFPATERSRILVTTHDRSVAKLLGRREPHQIKLQTKEDSWRLFNQRVHFLSELPQEVVNVAKEIVRKCGGLPFEILRFGYLMSGTDVNDPMLLKVLENIDLNKKPWHEMLEIAPKDRHDENLGEFLYLFPLFPRDYEIPVRRLVTLWVAKGIEARNGSTPEDNAEGYIKELIDRNMIQVVARKLNGKVKKCCLPSALQQIWMPNSGETDFQQDHSSTSHQFPFCRRQAFDHSAQNSSSHKDHHIDTSMPSVPRSYIDPYSFLSFDTQEGSKPGEVIGNSLRTEWKRFQSLRVLDLEHVFRPQLPNNIGNLHELRYLGLRWTYLESIPSSIGKLTNLQTLDMKHTYIREIPGSIWRLKKLRHLYLNQNYRSKIVDQGSANSVRNFQMVMYQPRSNSLKNLQTLWGVFIDEDSFLKDHLDELTNVKKLGLAFQLTSSLHKKKLASCLVNLENLKSLRLRSIGETGKPQNLYLESLEDFKQLSNLYLLGRLEIPSIISKFPKSLSYLTLSASELKDDPMPKLEKLPELKSLHFYAGSYAEREMVCSKGGFPKLLVLKLWKLGSLKKLQVEQGALQYLRELEIRSCNNLESIPGLNCLKSLQELKLTNMPENFTTSIQNKWWESWGEIAHPPRITKDNW